MVSGWPPDRIRFGPQWRSPTVSEGCRWWGVEEQLSHGPNPKALCDWSRDGRYLLYSEEAQDSADDLWALPLEGAMPAGSSTRKPMPVLKTPFREREAVFSPDGKWIAYEFNESGREEVYIMAFPGAAAAVGKWQVSNQG